MSTINDKPIGDRPSKEKNPVPPHTWRGGEVERARPGHQPEEEATRAEGNAPIRVDELLAEQEEEARRVAAGEGENGDDQRMRSHHGRPQDDRAKSNQEAKREAAAEDHASPDRPTRDNSL